MSKTLLKSGRPFVCFDPANKDHRQYFYNFQKNNSWINCPYQWIIEDDSLDVVHYISNKLVGYYMSAEFKKTKSKPVLKLNTVKKRATQ
jgi:hypothetical protein